MRDVEEWAAKPEARMFGPSPNDGGRIKAYLAAYRDWVRADAAVEERQWAYHAINLIHGEAACEDGDTDLVKVIHRERNAMLALLREAQATRSRLEVRE